MLDVNGQSIGDGTLELVKFAETASAVNEITVTNSATGNAPEIAATGDDTNIDLKLTPKGTGKLNLDGIKFPNADGSAGQALTTNGSGILSFSTISADGTADWDTTVKTADFTATANKGFFCNTTSAAFTVTLPATPSAGDEVIILDYAGTFDTNALIISPNGGKIEGGTSNLRLSGEREGVRLVYIDSTQGWLAYSGINEGTDALELITYSVDFLVVAGGGAGGRGYGGGGGAGGYRTSTQSVLPGTVITVTVGDGGSAPPTGNTPLQSASGSDSSISGSGLTTITSAGGGGGGFASSSGRDGGSGGGAGDGVPGGSGNTPSTSPSQGNNGGAGNGSVPYYGSGGGGGASAVGVAGTSTVGGNGGAGTASSITGSSVTRAGGGGGGTYSGGTVGSGGTGGGGNAGTSGGGNGTAGTANTGGGGGGASVNSPPDYFTYTGGAGGKGVVILSVPTTNYSSTTTGSPTVTTSGANTIMQFNGSGSYTA
jgi:hypothetical protein